MGREGLGKGTCMERVRAHEVVGCGKCTSSASAVLVEEEQLRKMFIPNYILFGIYREEWVIVHSCYRGEA